jgi:hypothetical protein
MGMKLGLSHYEKNFIVGVSQQGKIKLYLCFINYYAMKTYGEMDI